MEREAAKKIIKRLAACYPSWKIDRDIAGIWLEELEAADGDHVEANVKEYIKENKFPPSISEIIKPNQRIEANREIEKTRKYIEEQKAIENKPPTDPPWIREGISKEDWMHRIIAEGKRA